MGINNNYIKAIVGFTLAVSSVPIFAPVDTKAATFSDVPDAAYYADAVRELAERGIVIGFGDGTYKPNQITTRGQMAKILANILGLDTKNVIDPGFTDVFPSDPFYGAIAALAQAGIINGYEDRTFRMNEPVQRNHLAKMLVNAFHLQSPENATLPFTDVSEAYKDYVLTLYANGITTGRTATQFDGESYVTRGQLAAFVVRTETAIQSNTELPPPTEPLPEPTLTFTASIEGMAEIFLPNKEYEVITSAVIGKVYVEGDVVKITFVSEEAIPKESFKAKINKIEYEFDFSQHENTWIVKRFEDVVLPVPVTDISLNTTTTTLYEGNTTQLTASIFPSNATNQQVTWTSSNPMVASVDAAGLVDAVRQGTAIITATTVDGLKTAMATINVVTLPIPMPTPTPAPMPVPTPTPMPVSVTSITLNQPSSSLAVGETTTFIATVAPSNATNKNVTWTSSNDKVATVDAAGVVYAVAPGTATITATTLDGFKTATATINVVTLPIPMPVPTPTPMPVSVTSITLNQPSSSLAVGETTTFIATVAPSNATNKNVTWTSSNDKVATVDATGKVTAIGGGTATITATTVDGFKTATAIIDVVVPVTDITLNKTSENLNVGATTTLTATVTPSNATNKNVTWTSSDENVATVNRSGVVHAVAPGNATITATTTDGQHTATYVATVNPTVSIFGAIQIGNTLTADALTPTGATVTYQWQRSKPDGTYEDITGATNNTYTLVSGDENRSIRVVVTANDSSYSETVTSNSITAVARMVQVRFEQRAGTPFNKNQTTPQNYLLTLNILDTVQISSIKIEFTNISFVSDINRHFNSARASFGGNSQLFTLSYPKLPTPNYLIYRFPPNHTLNGTYTIPVSNGIAQTADSTSGTIKIWINDVLHETVEFGMQ